MMKSESKAESAPAQAGGHTSVPWEILTQNHNLYIGHKEPDQYTTSGLRWQFVGRPIPEQRSGAKRGCSPNWYGWSKTDEANAEIICRAVNSHADLLAALRDVMRCYVGDRNSANCAGESGVVADKARAIIAAAERGCL